MSAAGVLFGHGRTRVFTTGLVKTLAASARAWTGANGGAGAAKSFHTTPPCEAGLRLRGTVVSDKAQKSVVVAVERIYKHPVVKKYVKDRSKFMAHDELDQFKVQPPPSSAAFHFQECLSVSRSLREGGVMRTVGSKTGNWGDLFLRLQ